MTEYAYNLIQYQFSMSQFKIGANQVFEQTSLLMHKLIIDTYLSLSNIYSTPCYFKWKTQNTFKNISL